MRRFFLVSCVSQKLDRPAPAQDFYTSDWFKKARAFVEAMGDQWGILSAKYGFVYPTHTIAPYDLTLKNMPAAERRAWAHRVCKQIRQQIGPGYEYHILAGETYRQYLVPCLEQFAKVRVPMRGKGIGEQKWWLKTMAFQMGLGRPITNIRNL